MQCERRCSTDTERKREIETSSRYTYLPSLPTPPSGESTVDITAVVEGAESLELPATPPICQSANLIGKAENAEDEGR